MTGAHSGSPDEQLPKSLPRIARSYHGLPDPEYPFHNRDLVVTARGRICINRQKINLSIVFAGQKVGIKQVREEIWLVTFMDYDLERPASLSPQ